jgi:hypothetical protein
LFTSHAILFSFNFSLKYFSLSYSLSLLLKKFPFLFIKQNLFLRNEIACAQAVST